MKEPYWEDSVRVYAFGEISGSYTLDEIYEIFKDRLLKEVKEEWENKKPLDQDD